MPCWWSRQLTSDQLVKQGLPDLLRRPENPDMHVQIFRALVLLQSYPVRPQPASLW